MIRDQLAALRRAAFTVAIGVFVIGAALVGLYHLGMWAGWWVPIVVAGGVFLVVVGDFIYWARKLPRAWRTW